MERAVTRRALLSVFDKTGVADLAAGLAELGWELLASGGTARFLREAGAAVTDVAYHTGSPTMLGHRVVTLHPKIHGGILADRADSDHQAELEAHGIDPIDLVVVNLYPFDSAPHIETIDIGGPTLIRAAAKNYRYVGVLVDPGDYRRVLEELRSIGDLSDTTRRELARRAFARTATYDAAIVDWLDRSGGDPAVLPPTLHLTLERAELLRYGENPHQPGARYRRIGVADQEGRGVDWWDGAVRHGGLPLSYLNLLDAGAGWALVCDLGDRPAVAVIKHASPCGVAVGKDLPDAYTKAIECDPRAAFGGVVALNRVVDADAVAQMENAPQADVVIAPGFEEGAAARILERRTNTRILQAPATDSPTRTVRQVEGGWLVQAAAQYCPDQESWRVVTRRRPTVSEKDDAAFAWNVCGYALSNAAVMARDGTAWGIGSGQQDRVGAVKIAAAKASGKAAGGACASDGFFPFPDGIEAAAAAGVRLVIQPGGSVNDEAVIAAADRLGMSMVFTGERRFRH